MADKIKIGIDNEASPELRKIAGDVQDVGEAAQGAERQLNDAGNAVGKLADKSENIGGMSNKFTELASAVELLKKGFEIASAGLAALEAKGNPSALKLRTSFEGLQRSLLEVGDSRAAQAMLESLAGFVNTQLTPALESLPGLMDSIGDATGETLSQLGHWFGDAQNGISNLTLSAGEYFGVFAEGTAEELKLTRESRAALDEKNQALAELEATEGRILAAEKLLADARGKAAEQDGLSRLAKLDSERMILDLLEEERDAILEAAKAGTDGAGDQEAALRWVEILERRLIEVRKTAADDQIRQQAEASQARADAQAKLEAESRAAEEAASKSEAENLSAAIKAAETAANELRTLVEQSRGGQPSVIDQARSAISPEQVRAELVRKAQEDAAQRSQSMGGSRSDQRAAGRQAGIEAFRQFNAGQTSQADIAGAQNSLIEASAQQAQARGQLDQQTVQALTQAANNQQQMLAAQQAQAQQLQQINNALQTLGHGASSVGNRARAQRAGYGR